MSDPIVSYPDDAGATTFLLTVRGAMASATLEDAREVHNQTAGAAEGVAAARSLGDLSHNVYTPFGEDQQGELLFIDFWNSLSGLGQFFSNPQVEAGAGMLFTSRVNPVWAPADGFGSFHLPVPAGPTPAGIGLMRCAVTSLESAATAFRGYAAATINRSRLSGIVSHTLWVRVGPDAPDTAEVVGVDVWMDADEMARYYELSLGFEHLGPVFADKPDMSTWQAPTGGWTEW